MICTVEEAKEKWCPFTNVLSSHGSYNRTADGHIMLTSLCIGSKCMMWEWGMIATETVDGMKMVQAPVGGCGLTTKKIIKREEM